MIGLLGIYGVLGHGRDVDFMIAEFEASYPNARVVYVDDTHGPEASPGLPVLSWMDFLAAPERKAMAVAVADPRVREALSLKCDANDIPMHDLVHSSARLSRYAEIGQGAVIGPNALVSANVRAGRGLQVNAQCNVAHDCVLGDFVTLSPGVLCNGNVHIADHAFIGAGATISQGTPDTPRRIGAGAMIGMGAVVLSDVAPGAVVVGNPARPIKRGTSL